MNPLSYIQIDRQALLHNLGSLKRLAPAGANVAAVVKANAYGHGLEPVVKILDRQTDYFAVDDVDELIALRKLTQSPALVLGYIAKDALEEAVQLDAEIVLYDVERLEILSQLAKRLGKRPKIHLKIDAFLGRQGILPGELSQFLKKLKQHPEIEVVAAYSHFGNIEDTTDPTHAQAQTETFTEAFDLIRNAGWPELKRHESATSGALVHENRDSENSWIRLGVGLYGLYPSPALQRTFAHLGLTPVMRWVSHLAQVKTLPARHPVGYGLTYITSKETRIGIVPQGYSDGFDRGLSSSGEVLVAGVRCPVLGRVAMNMFAIDLSNVPDAQPEDEVVLMGGQGGDSISAEEIASRIGTINYEVVARVSPLLPRVVV